MADEIVNLAQVVAYIDSVNIRLEQLEEDADWTMASLPIGQTSLTIIDARIGANSAIDVWTSIYGVDPLTQTPSTGQVILTFPVQTVIMSVGVKVDGSTI